MLTLTEYSYYALHNTFQLHKALSQKYHAKVGITKEKLKKIEYLHNACIHIDAAYTGAIIVEENRNVISTLKGAQDLYHAQYNKISKTKLFLTDEITQLMATASNEKNTTRALKLYDTALDLAKKDNKYLQQFNIYCEISNVHASPLDLSKFHIHNTYTQQDNFKKVLTPLISAADLLLTHHIDVPNIKITDLADKLHQIANIFFYSSLLLNKMDEIFSLMSDAKNYQTWANKLSAHLKIENPTYLKLTEFLENDFQRLEHEKELTQQAILMKEQEELYYDNKLGSVIKFFECTEKTRIPKSRTPVHSRTIKSNANIFSSDDEDNDDIKIHTNNPQVINKPYNKIIEDIKENINLSDEFRLKALAFIKKGKDNFDFAIPYLRYTMAHLLYVSRLIHNHKSKDPEMVELDKGTRMLLNDTKGMLKQAYSYQEKIAANLEKSRLAAKQYIIATYGPDAWYKDGKMTHLSYHAFLLKKTNNRVKNLEKIIMTTIPKIHEYLNTTKTTKTKKAEPSSDLTFFNTQKIVTRPRSSSVDSSLSSQKKTVSQPSEKFRLV
jgi:hypothetical protein